MDEFVEALEKYQGLVPLVYDIETMSLDEARSEDMQYAVYLKREADKVIARQKFKRCLAMAKWCDAERDIFNLTPKVTKVEFFARWHKRWSMLAEKFKPNSTAQ